MEDLNYRQDLLASDTESLLLSEIKRQCPPSSPTCHVSGDLPMVTPPAMAEPSIPQEIIANIVENINDNLLRTCSLVSRSFLYPSRKRLSARIRLRAVRQCLGLLSLFVKYPYIQSYIKTLHRIPIPEP